MRLAPTISESIIELPSTDDMDGPIAVGVLIDGVKLQLCNWQDFEGWEVRRKVVFIGEPGINLGYIWNVNSRLPGRHHPVNVRRADGHASECEQPDVNAALRWLLS